MTKAHKAFLLFRDVAIIALLFAVVGFVGIVAISHDVRRALGYLLLMLIQYAILCVVAQNHGKRFVCNVLAEYLVGSHTK